MTRTPTPADTAAEDLIRLRGFTKMLAARKDEMTEAQRANLGTYLHRLFPHGTPDSSRRTPPRRAQDSR
jgi:hypothetical protein